MRDTRRTRKGDRITTRLLAMLAAIAVIGGSLFSAGTAALAHERREVGPYVFVVGFLNEPAFAGVLNGVSLSVTGASDEAPVEGLEETLRVSVFHAGLTTPLELDLRARFGRPGEYAAHFVPTREGAYTFRVTGTIDGTEIDERFESGPGRFDEVQSVSALQYPEAVPAGAELADELSEIRAVAEQTRILAAVALLLGIAALVLALVGRRA